MKKVIIVGATSGIGEAMARKFHSKKYQVGITGRRKERLDELSEEFDHQNVVIRQMDVVKFEDALLQLKSMIEEMGGVDIFIYNSGVGQINSDLKEELNTLDTNARGFVNLTKWVFDYFKTNDIQGQIVGVSSITALRGNRKVTVYAATKAFMSSYLDGLRHHSVKKKLGISVTDIRPGFVATEMTGKNKGMFWVSTATKAAHQIVNAIELKRRVAYITRRWSLVAILIKLMPDFIYYRN